MKQFSRRGSMLIARLSEFEISILTSLVQQVAGLLEGEAIVPAADPFERWQAEMSNADLDFADPVIARLFPEAVPDDQVATAEFRRLTAGRQRQERLGQIGVVLNDLEGNDEGSVEIAVANLDAWFKTLTAVRLSLAVRLGVETAVDLNQLEALPQNDPRSFLYSVYEWLTGFLSVLLDLA